MTGRDVVRWVWFPFGAVVRFIMRSGKRIAVTVIGLLLFMAGVVMIVTPGPGLLLIVAGLAVLATEYVWAERALAMAKDRARQARDAVLRKKPPGGGGPSGG